MLLAIVSDVAALSFLPAVHSLVHCRLLRLSLRGNDRFPPELDRDPPPPH